MSPVPGKRTVVVHAGDSRYEIARSTAEELGLHPGLELTAAVEESLQEAAARRTAAARALRHLRRRPRTILEMRRHLEEAGFQPLVVAHVVDALCAQKMLDDGDWAAWFVQARLARRPTGSLALVREMRERGVPAALAEEAVRKALPPDAELELARAAGRRRLPALGHLDGARARGRLFRFLTGRGFGDDTARIVCGELLDSEGPPSLDA
ncbi:MAG: RecX family transcriptional regulator [Candidatus Latescibacterota bacterium]|nr:MAG: RecX family transcriptional regulator [Candidatus Latescibacterota bacterium]